MVDEVAIPNTTDIEEVYAPPQRKLVAPTVPGEIVLSAQRHQTTQAALRNEGVREEKS